MKAYLRSARIAPKKANIIAKMVRGMPVPAAMHSLKRTNKKGARLVEKLLASAVANAEHNEKQDSAILVVKSIVVNQGQAYHRGVPMARGRMRPMKKFLSHISLTLGIADVETKTEKKSAKASAASQASKNAVKTSGAKKTTSKKKDASTESSESSSSSTPA